MKQHESSAATTATEPPVAVAVAAHPRSGSLGSSGNSSKMTLAQIQRQASLPVADKKLNKLLLGGLAASPPRSLVRTNSDPKMLPSCEEQGGNSIGNILV